MAHDLETLARTLVADGKGILAADETVPTLTKRFDPLGIRSTEESRRTYREMLFTAAGEAEFISGVILQDDARMNQPGRADGNWRWPFTEDMLTPESLGRLRELTQRSARIPSQSRSFTDRHVA